MSGTYTCPHCGMVSHNPNDEQYGYCGHCHRWNADDGGILCWFCPTCATMTLLRNAERGECCIEPRREDCPLKVPQ